MLIKRVFSLMTIIAIIVIMTTIEKIEVFFNVTRMQGKKVSPKIFVSQRKYLRQVPRWQKGQHARGGCGNAPTSHGGVHHKAHPVRDNKSVQQGDGGRGTSYHL